MKKTVKTIVAILFILIGLRGLFYVYINYFRYGDDWKERTSPLSPVTIATLCRNFDLEQDHALCAGKRDVYGPDFSRVIKDAFRPYEAYAIESSEAATYEDVEEKIGEFRYDCDPIVTTGDGFTFYICEYDLQGDREFPIAIMYTYPENAVFRIMINMGYDGE